MTPLVFFNTVLPDAGNYCVVPIRNKIPNPFFLSNVDHVADAISKIIPGWDVYFACSTYHTDENRTAENVMLTKSFWIDLDVGPQERKYPTKVDALDALRSFYKGLNLPRPLVVDSGGGVHAYWVLTAPIEYPVWKPIAEKLKAVCIEQGLKIDPTCTADAARILRAPGTNNYKQDTPRACEVMFDGKHTAIDAMSFATLLGAVPTSAPTNIHTPAALGPAFSGWVASTGTDDTTTNLIGTPRPSKFMNIVASGECAQITYIVENQDEVSEPLWRAGLSVANACVDREIAIHHMSDQHPDYNRADTERKAELTAGPYHCSRFRDERPSGCEGCPHAGKITSPIQLGKFIPLADADTEEVSGRDADNEDERTYTLPKYPWPFARGKDGEVVYQDPTKEPGSQDEIVYENAFYAVKRMNDPEAGELLWLRLHLPMDGVREFSIPLKDVFAKDRFRDAISAKGVAVMGKKLDLLMQYMLQWTRDLQKMKKTEHIRVQFGWTEHNTFILGDREIQADGVVYSPPASATLNVCNMLYKKGTREGWRRMADFYNAPGLEPQAFALFLGFGAPLLRFTPVRGGVINLLSNASGVGKSTVLMMINSIWGNPHDLLLQKTDTFNSRIHRMGVMQHLPVTMDEITNMSGGEISELVYSAFSGRGKNRMHAQTNAERVNTTTWQTPVITTSNSSLEDKLRGDKSFPEGELMRLLEMKIEQDYRHPKNYTDQLFSGLFEHFGVVGEIYMQFIVANLEQVQSTLDKMQQRIDANAALTQRERIWSCLAAVAMTGAQIAGALGLHNIDEQRVSRWLQAYLLEAKEEIGISRANNGIAALGTYIDSSQDATLIINDKAVNGMPTAPIRIPQRSLNIRIEPDTQYIFLASTPFRRWCSEHQVGIKELTHELEAAGVQVELTKKRMGKGTPNVAPSTNVIKLYDPNNVVFGFSRVDGSDASGSA